MAAYVLLLHRGERGGYATAGRVRPRSSDKFRDPVNGATCLSVIVVDQYGQPNERSYTRNTFSYGIKILRERRDPEELQELLKSAYEDYKLRFGKPEKTAVPDEEEYDDDTGFTSIDDEEADEPEEPGGLEWLPVF